MSHRFVHVRLLLDAFPGAPRIALINVKVPASTEPDKERAHDEEHRYAVNKLSLLLTRLVNEETT